ncbi:MAG: DUF4255 domain-containing protein [Pyrinomonadaceae bacterium]
MSNALAIAAVTTTLRSLLEHALGGVDVSTKPPDRARTGSTDQLNIFLYQTALEGALRNSPMPHQAKPGETGQPPLALNLFYLITAYGQNDEDRAGHQVLGRAMSLLHDHPLLGPGEIKDATGTEVPTSDLHLQIERVRITPQPLTTEEISKLWATFQTHYRISTAYQVSVVLIESKRATITPLPVLGRGSPSDAGVPSQASLTPPFPTILSVLPPLPSFLAPGEQPALLNFALLGDTLTIKGFNLDGTNVRVHIAHPLLAAERVLTPLGGNTDTEVRVVIPDEPANLPAGFYTLAVAVTRPGDSFSRMTNRLPFALAPDPTLPVTVRRTAQGHVTLNLVCRPEVRPQQRAALLIGNREIAAQPHTTQTGTLTFTFDIPVPSDPLAPVEYIARLRVDGVDSMLIDRAGPAPGFLNTERVIINPPLP